MVSIIVPVYNREKTICRCIESLLKQTYKNYEIIIIDDGSTDTTGEKCDYYARIDQRIHVQHTPNRGPAAARNRGLDIAHGDLIMFCDSDDYPHRDWVEILASYMKKKEVVMSVGNFNIVKADGIIKPFTSAQTGVLSVKDFILQRENLGLYYLWHSCYRRNSTRFDEALHLGEDAIYNLAYIQSYLHMSTSIIACTANCVYDYYIDTEESLSKQNKERTLFWEKLRKANQSFIVSYPYTEEDMDKINYMLFLRECKQFFENIECEPSLKKLKELMSSSYWDVYCQSMSEPSRWIWLFKRKSIALFFIYYRIYRPLRKMARRKPIK